MPTLLHVSINRPHVALDSFCHQIIEILVAKSLYASSKARLSLRKA